MVDLNLENQLEKLGLHKNEVKVYLALFDLGKARAGQIIKHTKLHRNIVYLALKSLHEYKLIAETVQNKVLLFEANDVKSILRLIREKEETAQNIISQLKQRQKEKPQDIVVYDGLEGTKQVLENNTAEAKSGDTLYIMGASRFSNNTELENHWRLFHKKRAKKGIKAKILYDRFVDPGIINWCNNLPLTEAKFFPFNIDTPVRFRFINDLLDIGILGDKPITFSIRNEEAVNAFKKYFEYFWNQQVSTETGLPALKNALYNMLNELESGEEYFVLGASVGGGDEQVQKLYDEFHADRIKKGVVVNMLAFKEGFKKIMDRFSYCGDPMGKTSHAKAFMSAPPTPMQINIFKNKVFFIIYSLKPTVISFDQPEIAQVFKNYFVEMWNQETQILKGAEALKDLWLEAIDCKELRWVGARGYFIDNYPEMFKEIKAKAEKTPGVVWKNVIDLGFKGHVLTRLPWSETRYNLSSGRNPIAIWLFGDKVLIINWAEKVPIIFLSTNKNLVQSYSDYFNEMWNLRK